MKKIGILTFHDTDNFGGVLQCMALQNTVKSLYPFVEVEIINYVPPEVKRLLMNRSQYEEIKSKFGKKTASDRFWENLKTFKGRVERIRKFHAFRERAEFVGACIFGG